MKLKEKDTQILNALGRGEDVNELARKLKLPKSTIYYHINKLRERGFIGGVKVSLDYEQLKEQRATMVLVSLNKTNSKDISAFEEELQKSNMISDIYAVTGDWDFLVVVRGKEENITKFIMETLQTMQNVKKTHSLFIMKHIEL